MNAEKTLVERLERMPRVGTDAQGDVAYSDEGKWIDRDAAIGWAEKADRRIAALTDRVCELESALQSTHDALTNWREPVPEAAVTAFKVLDSALTATPVQAVAPAPAPCATCEPCAHGVDRGCVYCHPAPTGEAKPLVESAEVCGSSTLRICTHVGHPAIHMGCRDAAQAKLIAARLLAPLTAEEQAAQLETEE